MEIDISKVIITIINFIILLLVLKHYLWKPVDNVIATRRDEIETTIKKTKEDEAEAERLKLESENNLKQSRAKGKEVVEEYKVKAEKLSDEMIKDAKAEVQTLMERAAKEVQREKERAESEIKDEVVELAVLLSAKALEESINEEQHRKLIKDFIAKVGI